MPLLENIYLATLVFVSARMLLQYFPLLFPIKQTKTYNKAKTLDGKILIQYPVMNEPIYLLKRFILSLNTIPEADRRHFHLQILDDYTVALPIDLFTNCPISFDLIRRPNRTGYDPKEPGKAKSKAGNMNYGLTKTGPEFKYVAIFDADHQVQDFGSMVNAAKTLQVNNDLWCVQSRWVMDNLDFFSPLSILQETNMGTHIDREQTFKSADKGDSIAIMNGAGSIMNLAWIKQEFGCWLERSITEDTDLTFEAHAKGKKVLVNSKWITLIDNPETWSAYKEQWSKWAKSNGQLSVYHLKTKHPNLSDKLIWFMWISSFAFAPLKYLSYYVVYNNICLTGQVTYVEYLCLIPHFVAWGAASQTWDNKFSFRKFIIFPLQYILEIGVLHVQVINFWKGVLNHTKDYEFKPTPKASR